MMCSSLNLGLFINENISDSPMCHCGTIENAQYFFHCNMKLRQQTLLLNSVANYCIPTLHVLLQGDPSLSGAINESIFQHVHDFIIYSRLF